MSTCPECGEEYSPQGMYGHLRMGHGLRGEDLERTYEEAQTGSNPTEEADHQPNLTDLPEVSTSTGEDREAADDRKPVERDQTAERSDRVSEAVDRLRRAKQRLHTAKQETGSEVEKERESPGVIGKLLGVNLLGQKSTETTVERTEAERELCRECRKEVEAAERELEKALEHEQVDRRYERTEA